MRKRWLRHRVVRWSGPVKVIENTGLWGVYSGERILLGDGRSVDDDLGVKIRKAFEPGAARALEQGTPVSEAFEIADAEITIRVRRHRT